MCHATVREECACCHIVPRSHGGLGVEKNIITLCPDCHRKYDTSPNRAEMSKGFTKYLESIYGPITKRDVVYDKWSFLNGDQ